MVMQVYNVKIDKMGRIVLPKEARQALNIQPEQTLRVCLDDKGIRVLTFEKALENLRNHIKKHVTNPEKILDEFLEERREEARKEEKEMEEYRQLAKDLDRNLKKSSFRPNYAEK